nr:polysaccharide deacetylase family protein [Alteraurantiacibacter aquimixticola]
MTEPPPRHAKAQFRPDFGQRFLVTVDTEEEFDWEAPLSRDGHSLRHLDRIHGFQQLCEAHSVVPLWLVDWPVATSPEAAELLRPSLESGRAEIGVQLHPWVNPPFEEEVSEHNSFAGNLPRELEEAKLTQLRDTIEANFGKEPLVYRAGRYGLGPNTAAILAEQGIAIDTSVRPLFDYGSMGGPDFRHFPLAPYWLDEERMLLELPLTTCFWGMLRRQGDLIFPRLWRMPAMRGVLARLGLLERIPLTPEGISVDEAIRGIDMALDDGLPLLVFSFHSPSLAPGHTPYVRSEEDLERLYDWWRAVFAYLQQRNIRPTSVAEIMQAVLRG